MTIGAWIAVIFVWVVVAVFGGLIIVEVCDCDYSLTKQVGYIVLTVVAALLVCGSVYGGVHWYYQNTASGQRALTDQKSELANGLERTITIYTADGEVIAQYTGQIDIEGNDGGYVLFDYDGKRYTYYNCFVESIAEIP